MKALIINNTIAREFPGSQKEPLPEFPKLYSPGNLTVAEWAQKGALVVEFDYPETDSQVEYISGKTYNTATGTIDFEISALPQPTLAEAKAAKIAEGDPVYNEFAVIIARCRVRNNPEPEGLTQAIQTAIQIQDATNNLINSKETVAEVQAIRYKEEDIEALKQLFKPYM